MSGSKRRSAWETLPTEAIHPRSRKLDVQSTDSLFAVLATEDRRVVRAVHAESRPMERAARLMARALSSGGRTFYVGAGTSGRLGVLEAAECPPTYGTDPSQVIPIMAGGESAVFRSKEGAEDDDRAGAAALRAYGVSSADLVVGISASSVTPFVRGALESARSADAMTVLVTCGPRVRGVADVVIAPAVGPEVLAGSTRMKAGTATKLVLNRVTLLAMIRLKKVFGPFMVDVRPTSAKLHDRALRMVEALGKVDRDRAARCLASAGGHVKTAVVMARLDVSRERARKRLQAAGSDLRRVLEREDANLKSQRRKRTTTKRA